MTTPSGEKIRYAYDDHGGVATATDAEGGVTTYGYDALGAVVKRVDAAGHEYDYAYNVRGELTERRLHDPSADNPAHVVDLVLDSYAYDPAGRLGSHTDAMGRTDRRIYWANDVLAEVDRQLPGGGMFVSAEYTFDKAGHLVRLETANGTRRVDYTVDAAGLNAM